MTVNITLINLWIKLLKKTASYYANTLFTITLIVVTYGLLMILNTLGR